MEFFISSAFADGANAAQGDGGMMGTLMLVVPLFLIMYFMLIRPQQKKQKEHASMVEALGKGDEVVTAGGILGKITEVGESFVTVEIAKDMQIKIQKGSIGTVMPKGTIKNS